MDYVLFFVLPFVIGYLLAKSVGLWGALLAPVALLIAMFFSAHLVSTGLINGQFAQTIEGAMLMSPYLVIIQTPIYFVGTLIGSFARSKSKNEITPLTKNEPSISPAYDATEQIHIGPQLSNKANYSSITVTILALTFVLFLLGLAYDKKRGSLEKDLVTYLLNNKQILRATGHVENEQYLHPAFSIGVEPQLTPQHTVYVFYVHGQRGDFTIAINVDGSAINPRFSLDSVRQGIRWSGEYR